MSEAPQENGQTQFHAMLAQGTAVSHYKVHSRLGAGGMGEVYLAEDTRLERKVALKFLPLAYVEADEIMARFVREARSAARALPNCSLSKR